MALLVPSCTIVHDQQYRTSFSTSGETLTTSAGAGLDQPAPVYEKHGEVDLYFVEFREDGEYWDEQQIEFFEQSMEKGLRSGAFENGILLVAYTHGWHHNASPDDGDIQKFVATLKKLSEEEKKRRANSMDGPRKVVGVYMGWRGLSIEESLRYVATYWGRKGTAHRIGEAKLADAIGRLYRTKQKIALGTDRTILMRTYPADAERMDRNMKRLRDSGESVRSRFVLFAHSFGGAASFSALHSRLDEKGTRREGARPEDIYEPRLLGQPAEGGIDVVDFAILVNPAIEALRYRKYDKKLEESDGQPAKPTKVMIFAAGNDLANGMALPVGQLLNFGLSDGRVGYHFVSKIHPAHQAALAHWSPYNTHYIDLFPGSSGAEVKLVSTKRLGKRLENPPAPPVAMEEFFHAGDPSPAILPAMVVYSRNAKIIDSHNGIWEAPFVEFLREYIIENDGLYERAVIEGLREP